jgi:hypothetical protein
MVKRFAAVLVLVLSTLVLLAGCGGSAQPDPPAPPAPAPAPLSASNLNLIFVVSEDLTYAAAGDMNRRTANLTNRGLQRTLLLASFLQKSVLGGKNVNAIYALEPMTHLQTSAQYPDMVALETVQQFSAMNQIALSYQSLPPITAYSYPVNVSYSSVPLPESVASPFLSCSNCQGLDFRDMDGDNETLVDGIIKANAPGFFVFSAPWETVRSVMAKINQLEGLNLPTPYSYAGPNTLYAISIAPFGKARLLTYNAAANPAWSYPVLPAGGIVPAPCLPVTTHTLFHVQVTGGVNGAVVPAGINTDQTVYFVRHAEAHPAQWWEDGNYIGKGQWRALDLPNALRNKIDPDLVLSIDPAQVLSGDPSPLGDDYSYVRTNLTVLPYAIANSLPYTLAADFEMMAQNPPQLATQASQFFFFGGEFSNHKLLVGWEHDHIPSTVNALLNAYHGPVLPDWPEKDYDTVWTVKLDAQGNVSVDNATCEGIDSALLPDAPPQF